MEKPTKEKTEKRLGGKKKQSWAKVSGSKSIYVIAQKKTKQKTEVEYR